MIWVQFVVSAVDTHQSGWCCAGGREGTSDGVRRGDDVVAG